MEDQSEIGYKKNFLEKILDHKALILIIFGIMIRLAMLLYYYWLHIESPGRSWGDMELYYESNRISPPLTIFMLDFFRFFSFERIEIFVFWGFFWDILTTLMFYFVIKSFNIKHANYAFALFIVNPFFFLNNAFSLENCGYHITDAFFFFFLFIALFFYPRKQVYSKYLFYIFLALSMCTKYYTIPAVGFFFLKYLIEKDWYEMKIFILSILPILILLLIVPIFITDWFLDVLISWKNYGKVPIDLPLFIKAIPPLIIALLFIFLRLDKSDPFEISIVSTITTASFMAFSYLYLRWFQSILFYGILKEREFTSFNFNLGFIKREIKVTNHLLTFYLSFLAVLFSYLLIIFNLV
ncbi:MAG: hypothetical protein ACFFA6_03590 [Promethearchaeota archaeon]